MFIRTEKTTCGKKLKEEFPKITSLDFVYEKSRNFDTLNNNLAKEVISASKTEDVLYLVDGNATLDNSCKIIIEKHKDTEIIDGITRAQKCATKYKLTKNYYSISAYDIENVKPYLPLIVYDVDNKFVASKVKLKLASIFGDDIPCCKFSDISEKNIRLYEMDYDDNFDYSTAILIDELSLTEKTRYTFDDLLDILEILRSENGCPWDKAQTKESIELNTIEETYELIDAINKNDNEGICEELGDLLMQTAFQILFAKEREAFTSFDVTSGVCQKLISRHTHIFGNDKATDSNSALFIWDKNKQKEKGYSSGYEYLDAIPKNFPALLRAHKLGSRAGKYNFDFSDAESVFNKIYEEIDEVKAEIKSGNKINLEKELGDLIFSVVNLTRKLGFNSEEALSKTNDKFLHRFQKMEELIIKDGKNIKELSEKEIDNYYNESKKS